MSVSIHRTSVAVRVCPSAHTGRSWLSISTHISTLVLGLSTLTLLVDCSGDFGSSGLSVQYTQDARGCPPAHTGRPWLSVCVRVCTSVSVSTHRTTVAVRVCPSAQTKRSCVSVSTHMTSVAVCVCPSAPQDVCGCPSVHISARWSLDSARWPFPWTVRVILAHVGCLFSTHRTSVGVHQHTQDVCGCPSVHISACWSLESALWPFLWTVWVILGPRGLSVQYTQDVRGCPPAHTGRPWLSVAVHLYTYQHVGPWT